MSYSQSPKPEPAGFGAEENPMPRPYSLEELLCMREENPARVFDISRLSSEISDIVKIPGHDHKHVNNDSCVPKSLTGNKIGEPCSRAGTLNHHGSTDSDDDMVVYRSHQPRSVYNEIKWQLRRRDSSDRSSQPLSAPSGLEAQKSENFQKFYRAVVSPTHVRVTAGGRIVPNTRIPPQPVFTWNAEKKFFEQIQCPPSPELDQQGSWLQGVPLHNAPEFAFDPMTNPSSGSFGFLLGNNISKLSSAYYDAQNIQAKSIGEQPAASNVPVSGSHEGGSQEGIKISPPSQFDVSRPFMYNGQLVYPVPPGFRVPQNVPMVPNMLGNPHVAHPLSATLPNTVFPAHLQVPPGNTINPLAMGLAGPQNSLPNASSFAPMILPVQSQLMGQSSGVIPLIHPPPLLTPGIIAAHQIQVLQQQIKGLDVQLSNNKHQVNEQHIALQRDSIQNQIFTLQSILNASIGPVNQEVIPPSTSYETGIPGASVTPGVTLSTWNASGTNRSSENRPLVQADSQFTSYLASTVGSEEPIGGDQAIAVARTNSTECAVQYEPLARKRLSAAAAMAPPFQPRTQQPIQRKLTEEKVKNASKELGYNPEQLSNPDETSEQIEARLLSRSSNWAPLPHQLNSVPMRSHSQVPTLPKAHSMHHPTYPSISNRSIPTLKKFATIQVHGLNDFRERVPYLRGYPPRDVPVDDVKPGDFLYTRKLTEDEIRAKYLYWGKAPREAMRGLPKWDGRDFYPPSPVKDLVGPATEFLGKKQRSEQESDVLGITLKTNPLQTGSVPLALHPRGKWSDLSDTFNEAKSTTSLSTANGANDEAVADVDDVASVDSWTVPNAVMQKVFNVPRRRSSIVLESESVPTTTNFVNTTNRLTNLHHPLTNTGQPSPSFLQGMLRNIPQTAMASATGAMSSATASGYLPPYRGSAAASLAPSISNIIAPTPGLERAASYCDGNIPSHPNSSDSILTENRPFLTSIAPVRNPMSAIRQLRRTGRLVKDHKDSSDSSLDQYTVGTGPVDSSEW